jgi:hypothetical protein
MILLNDLEDSMQQFDILNFLQISDFPKSQKSTLEKEHMQLISNYMYIKIAGLLSDAEVESVHSGEELIQLAHTKCSDLDSKIAEFMQEYKAEFLKRKELSDARKR